MCAVRVDGQDLLASAGSDGTVRLWDPATGDERRKLTGHTGWVRAVCAVRVDGQDLLASASDDQTVRLWDPATAAHEVLVVGLANRPVAVVSHSSAVLFIGLDSGVLALEVASTTT